MRVFRDIPKLDADNVKQVGGGGSVNGRVTAAARANVLGQFAYGAGLGRYIGGLVPDVSISTDGRIHPIRTYSWVAGVEELLSTHAAIAFYDSGVHTGASFSTDIDGTFIGFGFPGAPKADNRNIHEVTAVFAWQRWKIEGRGSMQWTTQVSWLARRPWSAVSGHSSAEATLVFTQLRFNLP